MSTGAFRKAPGVKKGKLGGYHEKPNVSILVPETKILQAEEEYTSRLRVASRKFQGAALESERARLYAELQAKVSRKRPNTPVQQAQTPPTSPGGSSDDDDTENEESPSPLA